MSIMTTIVLPSFGIPSIGIPSFGIQMSIMTTIVLPSFIMTTMNSLGICSDSDVYNDNNCITYYLH